MKNKIVKTLTMGLGCLMLVLPLSSGVLNHNSTKVHVDEDSPLGMI